MSYIDDHRASGFQVGDRVRVFASCLAMSDGWDNVWTENMVVGTESVISDDMDRHGFVLQIDGYAYPWFVLEKIND